MGNNPESGLVVGVGVAEGSCGTVTVGKNVGDTGAIVIVGNGVVVDAPRVGIGVGVCVGSELGHSQHQLLNGKSAILKPKGQHSFLHSFPCCLGEGLEP